MSDWKTLKEIYEEVKKFPFSVDIQAYNYNPYIFYAIAKSGRFLGENCLGEVTDCAPKVLAKLLPSEKPKKKVYEWLVQGKYAAPFLGGDLYSEDEAKKTYPNYKLTKLREFEIEVEE